MTRRLVVTAGPDTGKTYVIDQENFMVGRSKSTPTQLSDPHVSRVHCEIHVSEHAATIADNDSAGGTFVNGSRVTEQRLRPGDVIAIGDTQLRYESDEKPEEDTLPPPPKPGPLPARSLSELSGTTLSHYAIGPIIAKGQTSFVFRAKDTNNQTEVALKVLQPEVTQVTEEMQRFVRAMNTMLPMKHPNLVTILAAGKTGPYCWVAMEYVEGESLAAVIQKIGVAGMLDWRYALRAAVHICRALEFAERHSVIHRNISPNNILMRQADKVFKLGDLMLAKALEGTMVQQITRPGELLGEVNYMSPERTQANGTVDARSDLYSLGATIYAVLTGRPPFHAETLADTIKKIRQEDPVKPTKYHLAIPGQFEGTVLQMLAKKPDQRFQHACDCLEQLERVATFQNVAV
jgi:serine/threonine protein kinase